MIILIKIELLGIVANANNDDSEDNYGCRKSKINKSVLIGNFDFITTFIDKYEWSLSKDKIIESNSEESHQKLPVK